MKRFHVHVTVANLADSIGFYSAMFAHEPTVQKDDYAKWMLDDPRVNFAISTRSAQTGLNHLGIQVETAAELGQMQARLATLQGELKIEEGAACCYAKSDKYWVSDPQGVAWETFHTLGSIPVFGSDAANTQDQAACCVPPAKAEPNAACCVPAAGAGNAAKCC